MERRRRASRTPGAGVSAQCQARPARWSRRESQRTLRGCHALHWHPHPPLAQARATARRCTPRARPTLRWAAASQHALPRLPAHISGRSTPNTTHRLRGRRRCAAPKRTRSRDLCPAAQGASLHELAQRQRAAWPCAQRREPLLDGLESLRAACWPLRGSWRKPTHRAGAAFTRGARTRAAERRRRRRVALLLIGGPPNVYLQDAFCDASLPAKVRIDLLRVHHGLQHGQRKRQDGVEHKRRHPLGAAFAASRLCGGGGAARAFQDKRRKRAGCAARAGIAPAARR